MRKNQSLKDGAYSHVPMFHTADLNAILPFIQGTNVDDRQLQECEDKGLLPVKLASYFQMLKFLSRTVLAAQKAQRRHGVPASVLIAISTCESAWDADDLAASSRRFAAWQGCACCYSLDIEKWFLDKAEFISTSPKFRDALPLIHDVKTYVTKLYSLGLGNYLDGEDVLSIIEQFGLEECDLAAMLLPGEFHKRRYTAARDDSGVMQLKPFDLRRELAEMRGAAQSA